MKAYRKYKKSAERIFRELKRKYRQPLKGCIEIKEIKYNWNWRKIPILVVYDEGDNLIWSGDIPIHRGTIKKEVRCVRSL